MKNNVVWAILVLILIISFSNKNPQTTKQTLTITADQTSDLVSLIDAGVVFTGANKYLAGTSLSTESVRVMSENGENKDLGYKSLDSGTLSVSPEKNYIFYFFMNTTPSTQYYVDKQLYTGKLQDSVDNVIGKGCSIDTPLVVVRSSSGATQKSTATGETIGASSSSAVEVEIKSHSDKCFGTPNAPKNNVVCFNYHSAAFSAVKANTNFVSVPRSITASVNNSNANACYEFPLLADAETAILTVTLTSSADPTTDDNISIFVDDMGFDLNQEFLSEIWDYTDESGNQLGYSVTSTPRNYIRVA